MAADTSSPSLVTPQQSCVPAVDSFITGKKKKKEKKYAVFFLRHLEEGSLTNKKPSIGQTAATHTNKSGKTNNNNKAKTKISVPNRFEEDVEVIALPDGSKLTHRGKPFKGELWMRVVRLPVVPVRRSWALAVLLSREQACGPRGGFMPSAAARRWRFLGMGWRRRS